MNCRFCKSVLKDLMIDLGMSPLANAFISEKKIKLREEFYPLQVYVCRECFLVQLGIDQSPEKMFSNYVYLSSYSKTWLNHIKEFVEKTTKRFNLDKNSLIFEVASNDGYLLKFFKENEIPTLGIEPATNIAKIAEKNGIKTINKFVTLDTAKEIIKDHKKANMIIAFNVLPHVPDLSDFVQAIKEMLDHNGIIVIQFSDYLPVFFLENEFDTIYHEHFSYFSFLTIKKIFERFDLDIFDVEELSIHGGSLRIFVKHKLNYSISIESSVKKQLEKEIKMGFNQITKYSDFAERVIQLKQNIWEFLIKAKEGRKKIICYGAPAKGNTLLNYCGIGKDFIDYTVDINPYKQGLFLPGTHIPIFSPEKIKETKPDYIIILPWNLKEEIMEDNSYVHTWGGKFVTFIPEVRIHQ